MQGDLAKAPLVFAEDVALLRVLSTVTRLRKPQIAVDAQIRAEQMTAEAVFAGIPVCRFVSVQGVDSSGAHIMQCVDQLILVTVDTVSVKANGSACRELAQVGQQLCDRHCERTSQ